MKDVVSVTASDPYRLQIRFEDGVEGVIALDEMVQFDGIFEPLRDPAEFRKVRVHPELRVVSWPNGADLDSNAIYARITRTNPARLSRSQYCTTLGVMSVPKSLQQRLQLIVGLPLTCVVFIHDYIQFGFDGSTLTTVTLPSLKRSGLLLKPSQPGYCDALCSLIGVAVSLASVTDEGLTIGFDNGAELSVSLLATDYVGPEAINFVSEEGTIVV